MSPEPENQEPSDDAVIWRYMDLSRFVLLVFDRKIRFTKTANLLEGDPYEGFGQALGLDRPSRDPSNPIPADAAAMAIYSTMSHFASRDVNEAAELIFVNSWCLGPESLGMWMLYGSNGSGVALKSTVGQFKAALKRGLRPEQYRFGRVRYHTDLALAGNTTYDFTSGRVPASGNLWNVILQLAFNKRDAFEYEREWRAAIYQDRRAEIVGIDISVDLESLISAVYVGPRAGDAERNAIQVVMTRAGVERPLVPSSLLTRPTRLA